MLPKCRILVPRPQKFIPIVKNVALYIIAVVSPLVIMPFVNVVTVRSWWDFHNGSSHAYPPQHTLDEYFLNLATLGGTLTLVFFDWFCLKLLNILHSTAILGLSLTGAVTQVVKLTVGRPRPGNLIYPFPSTLLIVLYGIDILDRCLPPAGLSDPPYQLSNSTICTQTDVAILRDGFRSFPSGHSSRK